MRLQTRALSLDVAALGGASLPSEFRIFVAGWNQTEHGAFLFDDAAAAAVMAHAEAWGVDLAIDLEHQMLDPKPSADPTARDARGWCRLELRSDGSLWAVDVRWTPDGAQRLAEKRQRYVSPAFDVDVETKRVTQIVNVAITAIPATHKTPALVAASLKRCSAMTEEEIMAALDALEAGDQQKCVDMLKGMLAAMAAAGGDADAATEDAPPPAGDGGVDEATEAARPPEGAAPPPADGAEAAAEDEKKAQKAAAARVIELSGRATLGEALDDVAEWRASHIKLAAAQAKIDADRKALEADERRKLCVELITLGAEFPATVWADADAKALHQVWIDEPIAQLRARVANQRKARGASVAASRAKSGPAPARAGGRVFATAHGAIELSADELKTCADVGAKPEDYAANKAALEAQKRK